MGFCRYCGEILPSNVRCQCGGFSAPGLTSNGFAAFKQDRWSKTYVNATTTPAPQPPAQSPKPQRRFPRPISEPPQPRNPINSKISNNISSRISKDASYIIKPMQPEPEAGILPAFSPDGDSPSLTKVYGSLLSNETDGEFCAECHKDFIAEDTLYPQPTASGGTTGKFLCRECFVTCGGTRGFCAGCSGRVLILKSEGGFIQIGEQVYHKQCFICTGCGENASHNPMVDLLGRPCCSRPDCFDTCLRRKDPVRKKEPSPFRRDRETDDLSDRLTSVGRGRTYDLEMNEDSPQSTREMKRRSQPSMAAIEEMKRKYMVSRDLLSPPSSSTASPTSSSRCFPDGPQSHSFAGSRNRSPSPLRMENPITGRREVSPGPSQLNTELDTSPTTPTRPRTKSATSLVSSISTPPAQSSPRTSSRYESPPVDTSTVKSPSFKGAPNKCPGCGKTAFAMEKGVVAGPHATRWHSNCLVCATSSCKKKLDSSAKRDSNGQVRCRSCWLSLPQNLKSSSPSRPSSQMWGQF